MNVLKPPLPTWRKIVEYVFYCQSLSGSRKSGELPYSDSNDFFRLVLPDRIEESLC
jgi:hypothetical protein